MPFGQRTTDTLRVPLQPAEVNRKADELARHLKATAALEKERSDTAKSFGDEIKERKAIEAKLADDIATQSEERPVDVFEVPRYSEKLVDIVRDDTKEVIGTRSMQPSELQQGIKFEERQEELFGDDEDESPTAAPPTH